MTAGGARYRSAVHPAKAPNDHTAVTTPGMQTTRLGGSQRSGGGRSGSIAHRPYWTTPPFAWKTMMPRTERTTSAGQSQSSPGSEQVTSPARTDEGRQHFYTTVRWYDYGEMLCLPPMNNNDASHPPAPRCSRAPGPATHTKADIVSGQGCCTRKMGPKRPGAQDSSRMGLHPRGSEGYQGVNVILWRDCNGKNRCRQ